MINIVHSFTIQNPPPPAKKQNKNKPKLLFHHACLQLKILNNYFNCPQWKKIPTRKFATFYLFKNLTLTNKFLSKTNSAHFLVSKQSKKIYINTKLKTSKQLLQNNFLLYLQIEEYFIQFTLISFMNKI